MSLSVLSPDPLQGNVVKHVEGEKAGGREDHHALSQRATGRLYYEAYAGWPHGLASAGSATPTQGGESKKRIGSESF